MARRQRQFDRRSFGNLGAKALQQNEPVAPAVKHPVHTSLPVFQFARFLCQETDVCSVVGPPRRQTASAGRGLFGVLRIC